MRGETTSHPGGLSFADYVRESLDDVERAIRQVDHGAVESAVDLIATALSADLPLLVCGNGGSASDAMHITGELVGRFLRERRALNAICLASNPSVLTAIANDYGFEHVFARQVEAHAAAGGVLMAISTSGRSPNVINAAKAARQAKMAAIGLTGPGGGDLASHVDVLIAAPAASTPFVQQAHLVIYHFICAAVERRLSGQP